MPEAPLPPGILPAAALSRRRPATATRPAWLDEATFALMRQAARSAEPAADAAALAREVAAARYPALPAALLSEGALLAAGRDSPHGDAT